VSHVSAQNNNSCEIYSQALDSVIKVLQQKDTLVYGDSWSDNPDSIIIKGVSVKGKVKAKLVLESHRIQLSKSYADKIYTSFLGVPPKMPATLNKKAELVPKCLYKSNIREIKSYDSIHFGFEERGDSCFLITEGIMLSEIVYYGGHYAALVVHLFDKPREERGGIHFLFEKAKSGWRMLRQRRSNIPIQ